MAHQVQWFVSAMSLIIAMLSQSHHVSGGWTAVTIWLAPSPFVFGNIVIAFRRHFTVGVMWPLFIVVLSTIITIFYYYNHYCSQFTSFASNSVIKHSWLGDTKRIHFWDKIRSWLHNICPATTTADRSNCIHMSTAEQQSPDRKSSKNWVVVLEVRYLL